MYSNKVHLEIHSTNKVYIELDDLNKIIDEKRKHAVSHQEEIAFEKFSKEISQYKTDAQQYFTNLKARNMTYFSKITADYWTPKNKAHKAIGQVVRNYDKILIPKKDVPKFIQNIRENIDAINKQHSRTNDFHLQVWDNDTKEDIQIYVSGVFQMMIYRVKYEFDKL
jgi:sugar-specific transcriptional regulator TrmB